MILRCLYYLGHCLKQTKFGRTSTNNRTKYEYRQCRRGCGYKLTLDLADGDHMSYKELSIPEQHYDPEESPDKIRADKETMSSSNNYLLIIS